MDAEIVSTVFEVATRTKMTGAIIARGVRYEDFLRDYSGQHVEWVNGVVIRMSPIDERHDALTRFLDNLFQAYLELTGGGRVLQDPMVMKLGPDQPARQPDLQILLPESLGRIGQYAVIGPADLVVEVAAPESEHRDAIEKLAEYEQAGVREYWLLSPRHQRTSFWVLSSEGIYEVRETDAGGRYTSEILSQLQVDVSLFWRKPLPGYIETLRLVEAMLSTE
jgi:Uma2 family endonuclease